MTLSALIRKRRTKNFESVVDHGDKTAITAEGNNRERLADESLDLLVMDLVREFMEVDALTLSEARAIAAISIQPRPAEEWRAIIIEIEDLIRQYCATYAVSAGAQDGMMLALRSQSLASIPETLAWFRGELVPEKLRGQQNKARKVDGDKLVVKSGFSSQITA